MLLEKAMYGDPNCRAFGLSYGQTKASAVLRNAGWFNQRGEKLGYGDIDLSDIERIRKDIATGECFILLTEQATTWDMPKDFDRLCPGKDYVKQNGIWYITRSHGIFKVNDKVATIDSDGDGLIFWVFGPRTEIVDYYVDPYFKDPPAESADEEEKFYGLKVVYLPDDSKWAYGTRLELFNAAVKYTKETIWMDDLNEMKKYVPVTTEEIDCLTFLSEERGEKAMPLIKRIIGNKLDKWAEDLIHAHGVSRIAIYDNQIHDSDLIIGLPDGFRAFRID